MAKAAAADEATYRGLLSAARELSARKGYSGTSVREIVAAAGVTKPVLYYYFRNKEEIYLELFREPFAKLTALLGEVSKGRSSAIMRLRLFCSRLHLLFSEHAELLNLVQGFPPGTPHLDIEGCYRRLWQTLKQLIHQATDQGYFEKGNVEEKAALILGAVYMASHVRTREWEAGKRKNRLRNMLNLLFNGLRVSSAPITGRNRSLAEGKVTRFRTNAVCKRSVIYHGSGDQKRTSKNEEIDDDS